MILIEKWLDLLLKRINLMSLALKMINLVIIQRGSGQVRFNALNDGIFIKSDEYYITNDDSML